MASPNTATTSLPASGTNSHQVSLPDNALVLPATTQLQALLTVIRNEQTQRFELRVIR